MSDSNMEQTYRDFQSFWEETARYDRRSYLASFALAGASMIGVGAGIESVATGDATGILAITLGGLGAVAFGKIGMSGIDDYTESKSRAHTLRFKTEAAAKKD